MSEELRANRYRQLFKKIGGAEAHHLADELQVLALTNPDMLLEFERFIGREGQETDRTAGQSPEVRQTSEVRDRKSED